MAKGFKKFLSLAVTTLVLASCSTVPSNQTVPNNTTTQSNARMQINNDSNSLRDRIIHKNEILNIIPPKGMSIKANSSLTLRLVAQIPPFQVHGDTVQASNIFLSDDGKTAYVAYDIWKEPFGGGVQIIDVSDPYNPVMKAEMRLNDTDIYDLMAKNDKLYLAGASGGGDGYPPAFAEIMTLSNGGTQFGQSVKKIGVPSYAATGVDMSGDSLLVTSGDKGGAVSQIDTNSMELTKSFPVNDARGVSVSGNNVAVIGATPGQIHTFDATNPLTPKNQYSVAGATIPVSQSTIQLEGTTAYAAAGDGGFTVMDTSTGETKFNYKPQSGITNGVSYANNRAFLANGEDGISVMENNGNNQFSELGKIQLNGSSNVVLNKNCMLFAATGLDGLSIIVIEDGQTCGGTGPTPTPSPTVMPTVEPTITPVPTVAPTESPSPVPTVPAPSATVSPIPSPTPTPKEHDDNGHGNDPGKCDPSNPGNSKPDCERDTTNNGNNGNGQDKDKSNNGLGDTKDADNTTKGDDASNPGHNK